MDVVGYELEIDVDWDSLAKDGNVDQYELSIPDVYFAPVLKVFKDVCQDDMGKEALQEVVKKIEFKNENDIWSARDWVKLKGDVLILDHETTTNSGNIDDRAYYLNEVLENNF
ncbi:hypothetical protein [Aureibacter tunicatorum]|uniref:Uncharacterized protein n=1 Tax=Aureibacter tunicatorum TaxID=866807 RepID=A0AAE3XSC0_9BACT|nr:hypothetical protein [Aureibacter tunicatorum]MDR6241717.1 hypothetical protein [Aureibacter tunicatorum]